MRSDAAGHSSLTPAQKQDVENSVRGFAINVADDVTQQGPTAWRKYFSDGPEFFMAVNGQLAFPDSQTATRVIQDLPSKIKLIDVKWGNDLRIDPLSPNLAMVATSYTEIITDLQGHRSTHNGYFTGLAEYRDDRWRFRDAHWSELVPPPANP